MKVSKRENIAEVWDAYSKNKGLESRNILIFHYLPIVKYTAERLRSRFPRSVELDDLISAGFGTPSG